MVNIERILCPIDFSETSRHALEHAVAIARWYESRITALHVMHLPLLPPPPIIAAVSAPAPVGADRQLCEETLRAWLEPAHAAGIKTEAIVDEGSPSRLILEYAASAQSDLIVEGTHGHSGLERMMLGSVAETVLRKAACPVLTVPPAAATMGKVPYKRLLCPVDFSESSLAALQFAFALAKEADASLAILHVIDWPPDDDVLVLRFDVAEFRRVVEQDARNRLDTLVTGDVRAWCRPTPLIAYGKPYREILEVAEKEATDLIVIGVRGRNPVDLTLFGSTTNHVVRRASCPVLTLRR